MGDRRLVRGTRNHVCVCLRLYNFSSPSTIIYSCCVFSRSAMADADPSYIDYEAFLDPSFSPTAFANTLVLATNNPLDTPLDLTTPLSRVLFDVQEIDTHIDALTTRSAQPLLEHTADKAAASTRLLGELEGQVASLTAAYATLEKEVVERYEVAEQVRLVADRLCGTVRLARAVSRCLMLGRQLEVHMAELGGVGSAKKEDHTAMVRSAHTLLALRTAVSGSKARRRRRGPGPHCRGDDAPQRARGTWREEHCGARTADCQGVLHVVAANIGGDASGGDHVRPVRAHQGADDVGTGHSVSVVANASCYQG